MTPETLKHIRTTVLCLSAAKMAVALEMPGKWAGRTIRKWETPGADVPGPVAVAVRLLAESPALILERSRDGGSAIPNADVVDIPSDLVDGLAAALQAAGVPGPILDSIIAQVETWEKTLPFGKTAADAERKAAAMKRGKKRTAAEAEAAKHFALALDAAR